MTGGPKTVRARIRGRVQGVGFRAWTAETARGLGLSGWVRNRADGSVEALFAGSADAVEAMIAAAKQGPRHAVVEAVETADAQAPAEDGFQIDR